MKIIKKIDLIIIIILIVASFIPYGVFWLSRENSDYVYAEITVDGKKFREIRLDNHKGKENIKIKTSKGNNVIEVLDNKIAIIDSDCPDKICVKKGYISKLGQTSVCLPHRVIVEIKGKQKNDDEVDFISG